MKVQGKIVTVLTSLAVVFGGATTAAFASDDAVPGDFLYPIDRAVESVVGSFQMTDEAKAEYQVTILQERIDEYASLAEDDDNIDDAAEEVADQQLKAEERVRDLNREDQNMDNDTAREEIQNRYEIQEQKAYQIKEQAQNKTEDEGSTNSNSDSNGGRP